MKLRPGADPLSCLDLDDSEEGDWWEDRYDADEDSTERYERLANKAGVL